MERDAIATSSTDKSGLSALSRESASGTQWPPQHGRKFWIHMERRGGSDRAVAVYAGEANRQRFSALNLNDEREYPSPVLPSVITL